MQIKTFKYPTIHLSIMKQLNVTFEDEEHEFLISKKGEKSWRDWILELAKYAKK